MSSIDSSDPRPIHFVGIAGAGMRALAELLARRGVAVTGCDANPGPTEDLAALGITVVNGHSPDHVEGARELIVTSAMSKNHPELAGARSLPLPSSAEIIRYSLRATDNAGNNEGSRDARLIARNVRADGHGTTFAVSYDGDSLGEVALRVPGYHNIQNALAAIAVGL